MSCVIYTRMELSRNRIREISGSGLSAWWLRLGQTITRSGQQLDRLKYGWVLDLKQCTKWVRKLWKTARSAEIIIGRDQTARLMRSIATKGTKRSRQIKATKPDPPAGTHPPAEFEEAFDAENCQAKVLVENTNKWPIKPRSVKPMELTCRKCNK